MRVYALLVVFTLGCSHHDDTTAAPTADARPKRAIGVNPDKFDCEKFLPVTQINSLMGSAMTFTPPMQPTPTGAAAPCAYSAPADVVLAPPQKKGVPDAAPPPTKYVQYGIDCRPTAIGDAHIAFARDNVTPVVVGKQAIDDVRGLLVFIDDDTACEVRVIGPDAPTRLQLAKLVSTRLTPETAPTGVHAP